ncbi:MAG: hypothetical protein K2G29_00875 [Muribaculaceae bacterium]|nr:hypothetical protein [Muribaculaceae bacterium]
MSKLHILPIFSGALIALSIAAGCSRADKKTDHTSLPDDVKPAATAIISDSATKFAAAINYPLERPYPLPDIKDSAEMVSYYPTLIDDSIKNIVNTSADSLWIEDGWRGWTLDDGSYMWIDSGKVYQINYVSKRENQLLDSLRNEEISSLEPSLRKGWIPVLCIVDSVSGRIFRIDSDESVTPPQYRLAGYAADSDLSGLPTLVLYGTLDMEGSMENRFYHFEDSVGNSADYSPDIVSEEDTMPEIQFSRHGKIDRYKVKRGYWLEHVKRHHNDSTKRDAIEPADSISNDIDNSVTEKTDSI